MEERNPKNSPSYLKTFGHLLQVFLGRVSTKRYRIFRFCVHFTYQGDFLGVFQFLVPGISEK